MKRISNDDLEWLRSQVKISIRTSYLDTYRHGYYQMIDNCLDELQSYRKNAKTVQISISDKTLEKMVKKSVQKFIGDLIINCPNCGEKMVPSNSEIENSKSEIVPDYRDGWKLKEGDGS